MKKIISLIFFLAFLLTFFIKTYSQDIEALKYDWKDEIKITDVKADTSIQSVILKTKRIQQFVYENNSLVEYVTFHKKIKVLNKSSINKCNKIYIPQNNILKLILIKARVINSDGTVTKLKEDDIKEGVFDDSDVKYKYFALEGIEIGSEVEYLYKIKKEPAYNGYSVVVQDNNIKYNYEFDVIAPPNLIYKFKSYNGLKEFTEDTTVNEEINKWSLKCDTVDAVTEEIFSNYDNDVMRFMYKLDRNLYGKSDIISYGPISNSLYNRIYTLDKKETKIINKLLKEIPIFDNDTEKTVRSIENFIKKNFVFYDYSNKELSLLNSIYLNKAFNKFGAIKLFTNLYKEAGIKHEFVLTNDRYDLNFDKDFDTYLYLEDYLIYFPELDMLLSVANTESRLGFIPYRYIYNYGLFIKEVSVGDFYTGVSKVKFIPANDYQKSGHKTTINVTVDDDFYKSLLEIEQEFTGYYAYYTQTAYDFVKDEEKEEEMSKEFVNISGLDDEISEYKVINKGGVNFGVKPLIVTGKIETDKLIEVAGKKFIFKVGMLIGRQLELYNEKERELDFEFNYAHFLDRTLILNFPKDYKINNLESLKINEQFVLDGDTVFGFVSDYKLINNNSVEVIINEWYKGIRYDKKYFEDYKRVINAAANFNKTSLFLVKEE